MPSLYANLVGPSGPALSGGATEGDEMSDSTHSPTPWSYEPDINRIVSADDMCVAAPHIAGNPACDASWPPDAALRLHKAWADNEDRGPDYGGQTRDTHPDGERIWRTWFDTNLDLCRRAAE